MTIIFDFFVDNISLIYFLDIKSWSFDELFSIISILLIIVFFLFNSLIILKFLYDSPCDSLSAGKIED